VRIVFLNKISNPKYRSKKLTDLSMQTVMILKKKIFKVSQAWWCVPVIPALGKLT
jgi:hypothetical protein